jgi:CheY-like chemotaxis protein
MEHMVRSVGKRYPTRGQILIVDDSPTNRLKMKMAVEALGHEAITIDDGKKAISHLSVREFDVVLLDIVMPIMDGFEVLRRIRDDEDLRHIPVIVVSALEDMQDVAKAIKLGAVDFLPKNFDGVILSARIGSCLEKKRHRDQEIETLGEIRRLIVAAGELDSDSFNPLQSGVQDIAMRSDPMGQLAIVLLNKSIEVYNRQQHQKQQIKTLIGCFMLLFIGTCFGFNIVIAKLSIPAGANPVGIAVYTLTIGAVVAVVYALASRARWPSVNQRSVVYYTTWALLAPLLPQLLLFWVADELPAVLVAIIMTMEAFVVFFIAAILRLEKMNFRRFAGLCLGAGGVFIILIPEVDHNNGLDSRFVWLLAAMCIPLFFALRNIVIAVGKESDADPAASIACVYAIAAIVMFVIAASTNSIIAFRFPPGRLEWFMIAFAFVEAAGVIMFVKLVQTAGGVFASQKAYVVAIAGIIWSVILLGESISVMNFAALSATIAGMFLVAQKAKREILLRQHVDRAN